MTTGTSGATSRARRAASNPSMSGIWPSTITSEYGRRSAPAAARSPSASSGRANSRLSRPQPVRVCFSTSRLVASSSTTSTRWPCRSATTRAGTGTSAASSCTVNLKVLPWPGVLCGGQLAAHEAHQAPADPRPRPVPPNRRVVDESACVKSSKIRLELFGRDADAGVGDREARTAPAVGARARDEQRDLARGR